jgi:hypothetical protein
MRDRKDLNHRALMNGHTMRINGGKGVPLWHWLLRWRKK